MTLNEILQVYLALRHHPGSTDAVSPITVTAMSGELDHLEFGLLETWLFTTYHEQYNPPKAD